MGVYVYVYVDTMKSGWRAKLSPDHLVEHSRKALFFPYCTTIITTRMTATRITTCIYRYSLILG